jgi:hypothetical protein
MNARLIHGLLWREWLLHHVWLGWIFSAWLLGIWVLAIHPLYFLLPFGIVSALLIAPSFGGSDAAEGSEEFSFALPPTRSQRYLVRLTLGGGILTSLLLVGVAAAAFDLPQKLWSLLFETGFTVPFSKTEVDFVYVLSVVLPMAVFSECFAAGSSSRSPEATRLVWFRGVFVVGLLAGGSFIAENLVWPRGVTGYIVCPVLALWSLIRLVTGYRDYRCKEGVSGMPRLVSRSRSRAWIVIVILIAVALCSVVLLATARPTPSPVHPSVKED